MCNIQFYLDQENEENNYYISRHELFVEMIASGVRLGGKVMTKVSVIADQ